MKLNKKAFLLVISPLVGLLSVVFLAYHVFFAVPEVVYVDNLQLFDGFQMTKEMKKAGELQFTAQKLQIDSLYKKIQLSKPEEQQILMKEYVNMKEYLDNTTQQYAFEESQKIWKRLESYINDFTKEKNYKLIVGSSQKQDVLYADPKLNITNELIDYVNLKYEGVK